MTVAGTIVSGAAAWVAGRWVERSADLTPAPAPGDALARPPIDVSAYASTPRIARADRFTRIVASVAARALRGLPDPSTPAARSVAVASVLASAHTNEAFERRRRSTGRPVPRDFPYTAPNAAAGELAAALEARGPTLAAVGGMEVGLVALECAHRWLLADLCDRAIVVAAECPPDVSSSVAPPGVELMECAAAVVIERREAPAPFARLSAAWGAGGHEAPTRWAPLLSVAALGQLASAWHERTDIDVACVQATGASVRVALRW